MDHDDEEIPAVTLFEAGQIVATPPALAAMQIHGVPPLALLGRHLGGNWGDVPPEDAEANNQAVQCGGRILSAYRIGANARIWVITEADRSATTFLLPSEY